MQFTVRGEAAYAATGGKEMDPRLDTVLFIHGVGLDHTVWALPTRYFARHDRNVLAVDLPGHGRSGGSPLQSIEDMADWVIEALDAAGVGESALVGYSMGSLVALDAAARYPDRVRALAMISVSVPLAVADLVLHGAEGDAADAIDMLTYWGHSEAGKIGGSPTPGLWMTGGTKRILERAGHGVIQTDLTACDGYRAGLERAAALECPTMLIHGEKDRLTPMRGADGIKREIADQDTVIFPGAGHPLLAERSDEVLDELIRIV